MFGLGTIINVSAIIAGGIIGSFSGKLINESCRQTMIMACGISTLFIAMAGAMEGMLKIQGQGLITGGSMLIVLSLTIGGLIGEILKIEDGLEGFGEWLKVKSGNSKDKDFVNAFVTASLTVCIGAMAIIGAIEDGISGDYSILATKAVLDFIIIIIMTCSMGKGCGFSAIPVGVFQGSITLLARGIKPLMTETALANISLVGSVLIFCVGLNLVWGKKVKVANLLPAILVAVVFAFLPVDLP